MNVIIKLHEYLNFIFQVVFMEASWKKYFYTYGKYIVIQLANIRLQSLITLFGNHLCNPCIFQFNLFGKISNLILFSQQDLTQKNCNLIPTCSHIYLFIRDINLSTFHHYQVQRKYNTIRNESRLLY